MEHYAVLPDGTQVPALGQGTWFLGEHKAAGLREQEALTAGVSAGMTLIDTAEMYGSGKAELLIGKTIKEMDRSSLFLVSKVYPHNAGRKNIFKSCMASLERMGTDYLDLYLLHWRGGIPLEETVACMEQLKKEGKIRRWGVSNFDTEDMEELWSVPGGKNCAVNQVLYHVASRGIEYDLRRGLYESPVLKKVAKAHGASISQILLAFAIRDGSTIAIPRSGKKEHTLDNAGADGILLSQEELEWIDREFPAPSHKVYLDIV